MNIHEEERLSRRIALTVEERKNAVELRDRASRLREEFPDMSITQTVKLAAIQMGLEEPDRGADNDASENDANG
jgi:hypothetical protein